MLIGQVWEHSWAVEGCDWPSFEVDQVITDTLEAEALETHHSVLHSAMWISVGNSSFPKNWVGAQDCCDLLESFSIYAYHGI